MIDDSYFSISETKHSIPSLYIISDTPKCDIIWTENSDLINSFISEILKYESSIIVSSTEKAWAVLFTHLNELRQIDSQALCTKSNLDKHQLYFQYFLNRDWFEC